MSAENLPVNKLCLGAASVKLHSIQIFLFFPERCLRRFVFCSFLCNFSHPINLVREIMKGKNITLS